MSGISRIRTQILICLALAVITIAVFGQILGHRFVRYDDDVYVTLNEAVKAGLTGRSIFWALFTTANANWHPLTWLSLMTDYQIYGLDPRGFHLTNLLLHVANVLLLFLVLRRMTKSVWRSALVAALFGIHPLHVESVAWVGERKDVLSALFWMLTMGAYALYVERPGALRWRLTLIFFALGLMAKPMLVTLPIVLLLLDYWPLRRMKVAGSKDDGIPLADLAREKVPLFAMSFLSCFITYKAQQQGGAFSGPDAFPLPVRIWNALLSYAMYLQDTVSPKGLAVFYPHPEKGIPVWQIAVSVLVLASITALVIRSARSKPHLIVGWLWYVITLVPVIGLIQVGVQARADRYMYLPIIGLAVAVAWLLPGRRGDMETRGHGAMPSFAFAAATILLLAGAAYVQTGYWKDSVTLFTRATRVTRDNALAYVNLGMSLADERRFDEANAAYRESLRINPPSAKVHCNYAFSLFYSGDYAGSWREIHLSEKYGLRPPEEFIASLAQKMPDPSAE